MATKLLDPVAQHRRTAKAEFLAAQRSFDQAVEAQQVGRPRVVVAQHTRSARLHRRAAELQDDIATYLAAAS